jgi:hypothetical protein
MDVAVDRGVGTAFPQQPPDVSYKLQGIVAAWTMVDGNPPFPGSLVEYSWNLIEDRDIHGNILGAARLTKVNHPPLGAAVVEHRHQVQHAERTNALRLRNRPHYFATISQRNA